MATNTPNLNLVKPALTDLGDIQELNSNSDKIDTSVGNHYSGAADRHNTDDTDNVSGVTGETQTEVNNNLQSDRITGDSALQTQIDAIVAGGTIDPMTDVYKAKDLVNLNDYAITYGSIVPFDGMRFNIEVAQTNTGASTLNLNGNGAEPVLYLRDGVTYPVIGGMITGITELQYSVTHGGYIILTKEIPIKSDPITNISSVHQLGGDTYKDMEFDGVGETTIYGETAVNLVKNAGFDTTDGWSQTNLDYFTVSNNIGSFLANASGQIFRTISNLKQSSKVFFGVKVKSDSVDVKLFVSRVDSPFTTELDVSHSGSGNFEFLYGVSTIDADADYNFRIRDIRTSGWTEVQVKEAIAIVLEGDDLTLTEDQLAEKYQGYLPTGINHANGETVVTGKNLFDISDESMKKTDLFVNNTNGVVTSIVGTKSILVKIKEDVNYAIKLTGGDRNTWGFYANEPTENDVALSYGTGLVTGVAPAGSKYLMWYVSNVGTEFPSEITLIIGGESPIEHIEYQEQVAPYVNLKKLPNGVADEYNPISGIVTRGSAPTDEKVLIFDGTDITSMLTVGVNVDLAATDTPFKSDMVLSDELGTLIFVGYEETTFALYDDVANIGKFYRTSGGGVRFIVAKGTSLATAQSNLDGVEFTYQLATPITEQAEQSQLSYETGGIMYIKGEMAPKVEYKVNLNAASQRNANSNAIVRVEQESDRKSSENAASIALKPNRYSGSETFPIGLTDTVVNENVTADSLIRIYPQETTPGDKIGIWTVDSQAGQFVITSDVAETVAIPYVWEFFTGGE